MKNTSEGRKTLFSDLPQISKEPRFRVRVLSNKIAERNVIELILEKPDHFDFIPGQYVWLVLPERSTQAGLIDRRAYSICSSTQSSTIQFIIRLTKSDYITAVSRLKSGEEIEIIGPMGSTFMPAPNGAIMFAGGMGVAPFMSILRSDVSAKFGLVFYHAPEQDSFLYREFAKISQDRPHRVVQIYEGSPTIEQVKPLLTQSGTCPVFISGPQGFVHHMSTICRALGIKEDRLRFEAMYPTGSLERDLREVFLTSAPEFFPAEGLDAIPELGELFYMIVQQTTNHVIITDTNGAILYANEAAEKITGYSLKEMYLQTPRLWGGLMPMSFYRALWKHKASGHKIVYEILNRRKNGQLYVALVRITPITRQGKVIAYVATEEDITEFQRLDKAKTEFVSLASHQLRAPVTSIRLYIELLMKTLKRPSDHQKEYINSIEISLDRMVYLVNNFLNLSRVEAGKIQLIPVLTDVNDVIQGVMREVDPLAQEEQCTLSFNPQSQIAPLPLDRDFLHQVLHNLVVNGIKFSKEGKGQIDVYVDEANEQGKDYVRIRVKDEGIGIREEDQPHVFEKFFRAEPARLRSTEGIGLGLYVAKVILDQTGGSISFKSEEGIGSVFTVLIPKSGMTSSLPDIE